MARLVKLIPELVCIVGIAIFIAAVVLDQNPVYAAALLTFATGLAGFFARPLPPRARSPLLAWAGLALAVVSSVADGLLDLANRVGTATAVTTTGIVVGLVLAFLGRTTSASRSADGLDASR